MRPRAAILQVPGVLLERSLHSNSHDLPEKSGLFAVLESRDAACVATPQIIPRPHAALATVAATRRRGTRRSASRLFFSSLLSVLESQPAAASVHDDCTYNHARKHAAPGKHAARPRR